MAASILTRFLVNSVRDGPRLTINRCSKPRVLNSKRFYCQNSESAAATSAGEALRREDVIRVQNERFDEEKKKQLSLIARIEKIVVTFRGNDELEEPKTLMMNKGLSTPYNVAMHMNKMEMDLRRPALALVNGQLWDMLRPLTRNCEVQFLDFKSDNPEPVNEAFWMSCSHMLGAVALTAFKEDLPVHPIRQPDLPVGCGCFAYDVEVSGVDDWQPNAPELLCLSQEATRMQQKRLPFERLHVRSETAIHILKHSRYQCQQIEDDGESHVTLYRCGNFIDLCPGPMVTDTGFADLFAVTAVHDLPTNLTQSGAMRRFQGVAMTSDFGKIHFSTWEMLKDRARQSVDLDSSRLIPVLAAPEKDNLKSLNAPTTATQKSPGL